MKRYICVSDMFLFLMLLMRIHGFNKNTHSQGDELRLVSVFL